MDVQITQLFEISDEGLMEDDADGEKREGLGLRLKSRHGNGAEWRRVLLSSSPYLTLIYLHVTLPISSGDEKSNLISVLDSSRYPRPIPIPVVDKFFLKNKSIFQPQAQC